METVTVNLGARSYPIRIGTGLLAHVGSLLRKQGVRSGPAAIVTDSVVGPLYKKEVNEALCKADFKPIVIEIPSGEEHKNITWLSFLYDKLVEGGLERRSPLIALGGGV